VTFENYRQMSAAWDELAPRWATMTATERDETEAHYRAISRDPIADRLEVLTARFILGAIDLERGNA
jgi:hypothetical protein